jgi:N-hydroxyarylamine O-acetyltransferase
MEWATASATSGVLNTAQLRAYLARIGLGALNDAASPAPDAALLRRVVAAHAERIAFEMYDIPLGRVIDLALPAVFAKLVQSERGGLCLETNGLCAAALGALGFSVALRHARVWLRATAGYTPNDPPNSRQHMVLVVKADDGADWLVDVGFGGGGPPFPVRLDDSCAVVRSHGECFRAQAGDASAGEDSWVIWHVAAGAWRRMYSFEHVCHDCPRVHAADFLLCSHFVQCAPGQLFRTTRFATRPTPRGRVMLLKHELRESGPEQEGSEPEVRVTPLRDAAELAQAALQHLRIRLTAEEARVIFDADRDAPEKAPA